jgi:hypothetical protein
MQALDATWTKVDEMPPEVEIIPLQSPWRQKDVESEARILCSGSSPGRDGVAAEAGFKVGYEDASQFNREYKRHFGEPPMRDVERVRGLATA